MSTKVWVGSEQGSDAEWNLVKVFLGAFGAMIWMYKASNRYVEEVELDSDVSDLRSMFPDI